MPPSPKPQPAVVAIKLLHTVIWAFFVSCILAVPITAGLHRFRLTGLAAVWYCSSAWSSY